MIEEFDQITNDLEQKTGQKNELDEINKALSKIIVRQSKELNQAQVFNSIDDISKSR